MRANQESGYGPDDKQHAIVLSGNGAYAVYEGGIMKALVHGMCPVTSCRPIRPEIYTGTSVGALNAAMVVSGADESDVAAIENIERLWFTQVVESMRGVNDIFRLRANPLTRLIDFGRDTVYFSLELTKRMALFRTSLRTFPSLQDIEVVLNVLCIADMLLQRIAAVLKPLKLSPSQYNVLRILRGAGPEGLACREIGELMITRDPDITRLLDRLEASGLLTRTRDQKDRRVITALRHECANRRGHHMLAHLRTEAYPIYAKHVYPPASEAYAARHRLSYDLNNRRIDAKKHQGEASHPACCNTRISVVLLKGLLRLG